MPVLGALVVVIQLCFTYHTLKTGRGRWWLFVIMAFPVAGCVLFYLIEMFPASRERRRVEKAMRSIVASFDPKRSCASEPLWPLLGTYIAFVLVTWIAPTATPPYAAVASGRALSKEQLIASNWFGDAILVSIASLCAWLASSFTPFLVLAIGAGMMVIPISNSLEQDSLKTKILFIYTVILGAIGLFAVAVSGVDVMLLPAIVFALGISACGWVVNAGYDSLVKSCERDWRSM